jgi:signal transduction histidine kinase
VAGAEGRYEDEGWRIRKDGSRFWANVLITRIDDKDGSLVGFSKVTRDLTERKKMEDDLRKSRDDLEERVKQRTEELTAALSSRDEFLSIASHELKTPITGLKLQFQIGQRGLASGKSEVPTREELLASYSLALKQINSLADLVEDLLDTSRIQTGNFTLTLDDLDLSSIIEDVLKRFSGQLKAAGCAVELDLSTSAKGRWDRHRIEQVIVNLISNAIKYAPGSAIQISTAKHGNTATLVVRDFGPGVPKDQQVKIFDRFERAKASKNVGGLGLGLFIVRKIVDAHHGKVFVESEEGKGAKFTVELPVNLTKIHGGGEAK